MFIQIGDRCPLPIGPIFLNVTSYLWSSFEASKKCLLTDVPNQFNPEVKHWWLHYYFGIFWAIGELQCSVSIDMNLACVFCRHFPPLTTRKRSLLPCNGGGDSLILFVFYAEGRKEGSLSKMILVQCLSESKTRLGIIKSNTITHCLIKGIHFSCLLWFVVEFYSCLAWELLLLPCNAKTALKLPSPARCLH